MPSRFLATFLVGFIGAVAAWTHDYWRKSKAKRDKIIPRLVRTKSGRLDLERFSDYVARQMGFADADECPRLCKLAHDYLKRSEGCENNIYDFCAYMSSSQSYMYVKLMGEFEKCILTYFAFHWSRASLFINQVMDVESVRRPKPKGFDDNDLKQSFERVTEELKATMAFCTLVEESKAIDQGGSHCTEVMMPVELSERSPVLLLMGEVMMPVELSERSPVLLLMGGGLWADKSTVTKDILKEPLWSGAKAKAVVVEGLEADAFKESDAIYQSSLLVAALNEGRDVILDGTLSWEPFVEQTIAMARNVHIWRYRTGPGYQVAEDGTVDENYWEMVGLQEEEQRLNNEKGELTGRIPYRIELVGVVCNPYLAVVRGIRRAITTRRAVRVDSLLKSHKRFASAFERYCQLVDKARLYSTHSVGQPPSLIAWKDDFRGYIWLTDVRNFREEAESVYELYTDPSPIFEVGSFWHFIVMDPARRVDQSQLNFLIRKIESFYSHSEASLCL